jgi:hypothetical protein
MISPPSDRLHKFLAVGGVALILASVTVPVQKYQEADRQRIEAVAKARNVRLVFEPYREQVSRMERIQKDAISSRLTGKNLEDAKNQFFAINIEAEKLERETNAAILEMSREIDVALHLERMRNIWLALCALGVLLGSWLMFVGFKQWLRLPKHER